MQAPTPEQDNEQVRQLAYYKWERAGKPDHRSLEFWSEAEQEIMGYRTDFQYQIMEDQNKSELK